MSTNLNPVRSNLQKMNVDPPIGTSNGVKCPASAGLNILIATLITVFLVEFLPIFEPGAGKAEADFSNQETPEDLDMNSPAGASSFGTEIKMAFVQGNSLLPSFTPSNFEPIASHNIKMVIATGYSSTPDQTDSDPFITASGTSVREGVVATNVLPLGTKIKLPELYGDRVFVVEDRMHPRSGAQIDIWFSDRWQALNFGVKKTFIEILEG